MTPGTAILAEAYHGAQQPPAASVRKQELSQDLMLYIYNDW